MKDHGTDQNCTIGVAVGTIIGAIYVVTKQCEWLHNRTADIYKGQDGCEVRCLVASERQKQYLIWRPWKEIEIKGRSSNASPFSFVIFTRSIMKGKTTNQTFTKEQVMNEEPKESIRDRIKKYIANKEVDKKVKTHIEKHKIKYVIGATS